MDRRIKYPRKKIQSPFTFRPAEDVHRMLERASVDHPVVAKVINECCRVWLIKHGYAGKRELTTSGAHEAQ